MFIQTLVKLKSDHCTLIHEPAKIGVREKKTVHN